MPNRQKFDYLVIGAGLAGLSTAYFLTLKKAGRILLVEKEASPGLAASAQNASMVCQLSKDPLIRQMTLEGAILFQTELRKTLSKVSFKECGSLFIGAEKDLAPFGDAAETAQKRGVRAAFFDRKTTVRKFPFLDKSAFELALYCAADGIADVKSLVCELASAFVERGGVLLCSSKCALKKNDSGEFEIAIDEDVFQARVAVNAAGAWAGEIARSTGSTAVSVFPKRRHIFVTEGLPWVQPDWPLVWDQTQDIYFRPDGQMLLMSPCDEDPYKPGPVSVDEEARKLLEDKLKRLLPQASNASYSNAWGGLRTFAQDRRFIIGWDGSIKNFFWVACLGGHGVTVCASVGKLSSALLTGESVPSDLQRGFSPKRFNS